MGGLNLDKMKAKLNNVENPGSGKSNSLRWKPSEGKQDIRLLPPVDGSGDPFKSHFFHFGVGKFPFLCPKRNFDEPCAVCEQATDTWKLYTETQNEAIKSEAKKLFPAERYSSAIIERDAEDEGVKIWQYSKTIYKDLLNMVLDPDYGDITDVETGTDLSLHYTPGGGGAFAKTSLTAKRNTSKLAKSKKEQQTLLDQYPDFESYYERKTSAEVQEILDAHMGVTEADAEDASRELHKFGGQSKVDAALAALNE